MGWCWKLGPFGGLGLESGAMENSVGIKYAQGTKLHLHFCEDIA